MPTFRHAEDAAVAKKCVSCEMCMSVQVVPVPVASSTQHRSLLPCSAGPHEMQRADLRMRDDVLIHN